MRFRGLSAKDQKKSQLPALELNSQIGPHEVGEYMNNEIESFIFFHLRVRGWGLGLITFFPEMEGSITACKESTVR